MTFARSWCARVARRAVSRPGLGAGLLGALLVTGSSAQALRPTAAPGCAAPLSVGATVTDSTLLALHGSGQTFADFVAAAKARREGWLGLADTARVSDALVARARQVGGSWKLLVVAVDACGDSMNTVPWLARLAQDVPGIDLRIVLPAAGRAVQESHRSLDGRTATPTFVLLDAEGTERGCIVEQPRPLRDWARATRGTVSLDSLHVGIRAFYAANRGEAIVTEAIEMLEAAKAGQRHCFTGQAAAR
ncbi:thioredoxin family protein [Gemmatimonas sp. UBA7669]|jgi:hypothetical protein|uniref:thioredoxin family protein n=1 Tax=Gemmatimonas sp. UBA7669 TaxID=1946568 RepID=UPI0025C2B428|nr:thioredoxin family protein [Gemmatimonas sp. UBA7669]